MQQSKELLGLLDAAEHYTSRYQYVQRFTRSVKNLDAEEDDLQDAAIEFLQARGLRVGLATP